MTDTIFRTFPSSRKTDHPEAVDKQGVHLSAGVKTMISRRNGVVSGPNRQKGMKRNEVSV
jgi:hypothetical protein